MNDCHELGPRYRQLAGWKLCSALLAGGVVVCSPAHVHGADPASAVEPASESAVGAAAAQQSWIDRILEKLGASKEVDLSHGIDWGILPGPFYNPEMGFGIGAAAIGLYQPSNAARTTQLSTLSIRGFGTVKGAYGISIENNTFFADDSYRFLVEAALINMPTAYWGVGYDNAIDNANRETYTRKQVLLQPRMMFRVRPNVYVGAGWSLQYDDAVKLERGADSALARDPNGPRVLSSGVSAHFSYDTRDFIPNPYQGESLLINTVIYRRGLGSDTDLENLEITANKYFRVRERDVLAFDVYANMNWGDVPWDMMATLGNNKRMRGYFQGQYRDKVMAGVQVEYRWHIVGRQGMVFWLGTGAIAPNPGALASAHWLPNAGIGYRFEFKPRVNVRFDAGVGSHTKGVYFQINEAF
ncbi:BamA/TamA family outer membrane protein [Cupriavidus pampae]|nr:BamA/TamA family outer membrane protein [Cupriavidus pampae]